MELFSSPDAFYNLRLSIRGGAVEGLGQEDFAGSAYTPPVDYVVGSQVTGAIHRAL